MMRTGWLIVPAVVLALIAGGAIGAAVADNDHDRGDRVIQVTAPPSESGQQPQVITIDDDGGHWRHGFFPFGFLFPLLWIGLIILVISFVFRRGRGGGPGRWGGGPGSWNDKFEDWHRRQHEGDVPPAAGPAASA
ncbi:MAG: hypothetical protein AB7P33_13050 [Dehalococcoidia bacterium]